MDAGDRTARGSVREQDSTDVHHGWTESGQWAGSGSVGARGEVVSVAIVHPCWSIVTPALLDPGGGAPDDVNDPGLVH